MPENAQLHHFALNNPTLLSVLCNKSDDAIEVINPASDETLGYVPSLSKNAIIDIIERAHLAQKQWANLPAKSRSAMLRHWYELVMANQDDLARIMTLEQGKPFAEAKGEVAYGASFIQWFAEEAKRTYGESIPATSEDKRIITIKQPVGVAAAITPWNFPIAMITRKAAPALAAGCSFIAKPANQTPLSAYAVAELAYQAGIPRDLLAMVNSHSSVMVGQLFSTHPLIQKLSFTGSTEVGRVLMSQSADTVKRTSMELGGNAPFIVFEDADIERAVQGALASKFRNAGQTCVCANRFYVHDSVYDDFVQQFSRAIRTLKVGHGLDEGVSIGPLIDRRAKDQILALIQGAVVQGAQIATGGEDLGGLFIAPTLLTEVTQNMDIVQKEIFGPVAPVLRFSNDSELIAMANDTIHGLASYFFSQNINRVFHIAEALEFGMVGINEGIISTEVAPFGGVKQSGIGREGGRQGIEEYLHTKYLCFGSL
ncbi:NAD-dependent succinate-semialdehyde dehydrogenase [Photobacterium sp. TLY01]|uniref:NAD-dependent succinate-semialdehyde dehydrogenase n=1 Tax=Photobacterium sp. TLY01 TaxID=2907534 RepID=UPI001F35673F|nr:NAD-dependent succinate-semialdehyde dehydrogenase [Photobacterium sp. TLY01]UIP26731.1 NAD-dependent succinate-semialdehyde dehydrogenase [Photobacterium sp. TLY01]